MRLLRLVVLLFFSVAMDFAAPLAPAPAGAFDGMEEEVHVTRARRVDRLASSLHRSPRPRVASVENARRAWRPQSTPQARRTAGRDVRKLPSSIVDSSSAPEDH
jgi:hypothetical protein